LNQRRNQFGKRKLGDFIRKSFSVLKYTHVTTKVVAQLAQVAKLIETIVEDGRPICY